ncbi:hypothetical protein OROGR_005411 [Orobanche gracilis]
MESIAIKFPFETCHLLENIEVHAEKPASSISPPIASSTEYKKATDGNPKNDADISIVGLKPTGSEILSTHLGGNPISGAAGGVLLPRAEGSAENIDEPVTGVPNLGLEEGEIPNGAVTLDLGPKKVAGVPSESSSSSGFWLEAGKLAEKLDLPANNVRGNRSLVAAAGRAEDAARFPEVMWDTAAVIAANIRKYISPPVSEAALGDGSKDGGRPPQAHPAAVLDAILVPGNGSGDGQLTSLAPGLNQARRRRKLLLVADLVQERSRFPLRRRLRARVWIHLLGRLTFQARFPPRSSPKWTALRNLKNSGFGHCKVQILNFKHVLITLPNEELYSKLWLKREFNVLGSPMRLFKWDPTFNFKYEPATVPVWVKIFDLPIQWFHIRALQTVGSLIGTFIKADLNTINRSRLNFARICVEVNLKNHLYNSVGIRFDDVITELNVEYEKLPSYCNHCQHLGHDIDACYFRYPNLRLTNFNPKTQKISLDKGKGKEIDPGWIQVGNNDKASTSRVGDEQAVANIQKEISVVDSDVNPNDAMANVLCKDTTGIETGAQSEDDREVPTANRFLMLENFEDSESLPPLNICNSNRIDNTPPPLKSNSAGKKVRKRPSSSRSTSNMGSPTHNHDKMASIPSSSPPLSTLILDRNVVNDVNGGAPENSLVGPETEPVGVTQDPILFPLIQMVSDGESEPSEDRGDTNIKEIILLSSRTWKNSVMPLLTVGYRMGAMWGLLLVAEARDRVVAAEALFDGDPSNVNKNNLRFLNDKWIDILTMAEMFWKQKTSMKWILEGGRNNKFFHDLIKKKRKTNFIHCMVENGAVLTEPMAIAESAVNYFEKVLTEPMAIAESAVNYFENCFKMDNWEGDSVRTVLIPKSIDEVDNNRICEIPSLEEIRCVIFEMEKESVAGPDGFNANFPWLYILMV